MKKAVARVLGNFGVSFFSPLISINIADNLYNIGFTLEQMIVISLISAAFVTGLTMSRELEKYGKGRK